MGRLKCALCQNRTTKEKKLSFFTVPKVEHLRKRWIDRCGVNFSKCASVCEDHFLPSDFINGPGVSTAQVRLQPGAVPSLLLQTLANEDVSSALVDDVTGLVHPRTQTVGAKRIKLMSNSVAFLNSGLPPPPPLTCFKKQRDGSTMATPMKIVNHKDCHTQTDSIVLNCFTEVENCELKKQIKEIKEENNRLKLQLQKSNAILTTVRSLFTEGQIRKMMIPEINIKWRWSDISNAICLHAAGPRAYNHLYEKGFPLPHISTLQRWYRMIDVKEGILTAAVDLLRQVTDLSNEEKICVLAFDQVADCVIKPVKNVQLIMAHGLKKSWAQPVYFDFDRQLTKNVIHSIISVLHDASFPVVAVVCDMEPTNRELFESLGVTPEKPWFINPSNPEEKVFGIADAPHLLKSIRNNFLDTGLLWNDELLTSRTITDLIKHSSKSDSPITCKLTDEHLSVKGTGRQKVKLAAQMFSHTTANAIRACSSLNLELHKPTETADMLQLVNDWFDIMNSTTKTMSHPGKEPFGLKLRRQGNIILKMSEFISLPIIPGKDSLEDFQNDVLLTNASVLLLYQYVKEKYNIEYIVTKRLNCDILDDFFGAMRSKGGLIDHPTPKEFKFRLRKYILGMVFFHFSTEP